MSCSLRLPVLHSLTQMGLVKASDEEESLLYLVEKAGVAVSDIQVKSGSLEDAFVRLTKTDDKERVQGYR